jgi:hypothetical protein
MDNPAEEFNTDITIGDLKVLASIIELASSKGLFKPADLTNVGQVYDKIVDVIKKSSVK